MENININEIYKEFSVLLTEDLWVMASELAGSYMLEPNPTKAARIDVALVILSDRLPADIFVALCDECNIDLDHGGH
jgi:hypothetical protein